ncbi:nucleolar protein 11-like isoform X3 [Frankliniella occidentalis]|uniref:Nucleolar protein 11-like isoform X3 n=1 Tax=Frankliniella occidentalis TaxID=133901 RepID=A0A9C6X2N5_FRAOC|nr:nucleolar protein 11-like isoform X3 [Frankliniella occidentalis]
MSPVSTTAAMEKNGVNGHDAKAAAAALGSPSHGVQSGPEGGRMLFQYLGAGAACLFAVCMGTTMGWTSAAERLQYSNITGSDWELGSTEYSLVGAFMPLGALLAALPTGPAMAKWGRRNMMLALSPILFCAWLLIIFAQNAWMIILARLIIGAAIGSISMIAPLYSNEIAHKSVRGTLGGFFQFLHTCGVLFAYVLGWAITGPMTWISVICACVPVVAALAFFFFPDTPTWYLQQGRPEDARRSLIMFRGEDYPEHLLQAELDDISNELKAAAENKKTLKEAFTTKEAKLGLALSMNLMIVQQLSGVSAVVFYAAKIFEKAGSTLSKEVAAIVMGACLAGATLVSLFLVDRFGRRLLLLVSGAACVISNVILGIYLLILLADQKQASSWSSKDKLSAPVIYDEVGKQYIAVFNQSIVRTWDSTEVDLNKLKKLKFDHPIHSILNRSSKSEPVVVFKNGAAISLSAALSDRRKLWPGPLSSHVTIKDCFFMKLDGTDCITFVVAQEKGGVKLYISEVDSTSAPLLSVPLERADKKLLGHTVMVVEGSVSILTLWNDGQLYSLSLKKFPSEQSGVGCAIYTVKAVSLKNVVAMTQISTHHLAIYGADPSEEGAMLVIVNTQFMLVQAHQHYKLFSNNTNLWIIGTSLLLVVGNSLAVVPFILDTERLCALIGSHKPLKSKSNEVEQILEMENVSWEDADNIKSSIETNAVNRKDWVGLKSVENLVAQGYSQAMLCEELIPFLIEKVKIHDIIQLLKKLPDFPEESLVRILIFCLDSPASAFKSMKNQMENGVDSELMEVDGEDDSRDSQNALVELSQGQRILLDVIIRTPFSEAIILPYLRSRLNLPHCLALLQYIAQSLPQTANVSYSKSLLKWSAVLLDSHYQQLLLSKDECVSSTIFAIKELVESQVEYMEDLKVLQPILERVKCGQLFQKQNTLTNNFYSIETLRLY